MKIQVFSFILLSLVTASASFEAVDSIKPLQMMQVSEGVYLLAPPLCGRSQTTFASGMFAPNDSSPPDKPEDLSFKAFEYSKKGTAGFRQQRVLLPGLVVRMPLRYFYGLVPSLPSDKALKNCKTLAQLRKLLGEPLPLARADWSLFTQGAKDEFIALSLQCSVTKKGIVDGMLIKRAVLKPSLQSAVAPNHAMQLTGSARHGLCYRPADLPAQAAPHSACS